MPNNKKNTPNSIQIPIPQANQSLDIQWFDFPSIGIAKSGLNIPGCNEEFAFLSKLNFDFLHIDVNLYQRGWESYINTSISESSALGWPLKITLFVDDASHNLIPLFVEIISKTDIKHLNVCLVNSDLLHKKGKDEILNLKQLSGGKNVGCEVKTSFIENAENKYFTNNFDFINYTFSLRLSGYKYLHFSPGLSHQLKTISLLTNLNNSIHVKVKQAFVNSNNIVKANILADSDISLANHEKQNLIYSAGWVIRYLQQFLQKGVRHFTFFELCGDKGIIEQTDNEINNENSHTFAFLPLYHVLHAIMQFKEGKIYPIDLDNLDLCAILLIKSGERRLLSANLSNSEHELKIEGITQFISVRKMDYTTLEKSIYCPLWIIGKPEFTETNNNSYFLKMTQFSIIMIDLLKISENYDKWKLRFYI